MDLKRLSYIPAFGVISNVADKPLGKKVNVGILFDFALIRTGVNFTKLSKRRFEVHTHCTKI